MKIDPSKKLHAFGMNVMHFGTSSADFTRHIELEKVGKWEMQRFRSRLDKFFAFTENSWVPIHRTQRTPT
jgi:hypothetical protein